MQDLFRIKSIILHWLLTVDEHSIHSPYFFDFYTQVLKKKNDESPFNPIENVRQKLLNSQFEVNITDLGAPSPHFTNSKRNVSDVARTSLNSKDYCRLYYRIAEHCEARRIVELGTSMGITALYFSELSKSEVYTFEGNKAMIDIALTNFEFFNKKNIHLTEGKIDATLPEFLQNPLKINFVLMDANHRYEPTLRYFNWLSRRMADKGIIVVDDIYHSEEMERAWRELRGHDLIYGSIDLFQCGILFFDPALNKQHFVMTM